MKNQEFLERFDFIPCQDKYEGVLGEKGMMLGDCETTGGVLRSDLNGLGDCGPLSIN